MTKSITGSFYLTETVTMPAASVDGSRFQETVDLSAYVNVPTGQALAIESVDFIWQSGLDLGNKLSNMVTADTALGAQLTDLNPGTAFVLANSQALCASATLNIDFTNNVATHTADLYPDNFGPTSLSEAFLVVNDTLYLTIGNDGSQSSSINYLTARIRCRVVKLSTKDWMAIAIQSTAEA